MSRVAIAVGEDYEDSELEVPMRALKEAGHEVVLIGERAKQSLSGKAGRSKVTTDVRAADVQAKDFAALVIPGGYSPDHLRTDEGIVNFVEDAIRAKLTIAAVCHGPSLLIEADACRGVRMTSWPSIRKDLVNAGAHWEDQAVVRDGNFITSRNPGDLEAFTGAILEQLDPPQQPTAQR